MPVRALGSGPSASAVPPQGRNACTGDAPVRTAGGVAPATPTADGRGALAITGEPGSVLGMPTGLEPVIPALERRGVRPATPASCW